jgi:hypothetical protein
MAPASRVSAEVASRARGLNAYVARMERLAAKGDLTHVDLRRVYAGTMLSFFTYLERSVERLFLGLLMGRFELSEVEPLIAVRSERVARAVLVGAKPYIDWLPFDRYTVPRAHAFFAGGRPFSAVPTPDITALERLNVIRNAIAHESTHAQRQFRRRFVKSSALPPSQHTPSGYLRGQHSVGVTRLNYIFADMSRIFANICS